MFDDIIKHKQVCLNQVFKYTNFGVISWIHDDFFIQAGKSTRDQSLRELRYLLLEWYQSFQLDINITMSRLQKQRKKITEIHEDGQK